MDRERRLFSNPLKASTKGWNWLWRSLENLWLGWDFSCRLAQLNLNLQPTCSLASWDLGLGSFHREFPASTGPVIPF